MLPYDIGLSGSWKVQSGFNYARTMSVTLPVEGARTVRVFNLTNAGTVTTVRVTNTATAPFNEVTAILNPRVVRAGIRFAF